VERMQKIECENWLLSRLCGLFIRLLHAVEHSGSDHRDFDRAVCLERTDECRF